jgi:hypothetical protein
MKTTFSRKNPIRVQIVTRHSQPHRRAVLGAY